MDAPHATIAANLPEYTVTELCVAVKRTVEGAFGRVRVRGEISRLQARHARATSISRLKDADARARRACAGAAPSAACG